MGKSRAKSPTKIRPPRRANCSGKADRPLCFIDLFAGCGGLSLGLEEAGFQPLLFNEINHSAADTYRANRADLEDLEYVKDIHNLTNARLKKLLARWKTMGVKEIDLVCGGPPCQGYSGIGHRRTFKLEKRQIPSNRLYKEMARVIRCVKPKIFLFENVKGLLHSRWTPDGQKGEIFSHVLACFKRIKNYRVRWDLLHAKDYGVPQNRPRVLIVGIREDLATRLPPGMLLEPPPDGPSAVDAGFLPQPSGEPPTLPELLSDLIDPAFPKVVATTRYPKAAKEGSIQEKLRTDRNGRILKKGARLTEHEYSNHSTEIRAKFRHMIDNAGEILPEHQTKKFAQRVFPEEWPTSGPNITATSLPDDYVHFLQARAPTVREWARLQTFPDWYQFRGPRTTGGRRRAGDPSVGDWEREVPKYTQIGNAVPVALAEQIGLHLATILRGATARRI